jgi:hypothetical protein
MKIISSNRPIVEDYSNAGGLKGKLKGLQGSGKVQGFLGKAQNVLGALGGGAGQQGSQVQSMEQAPTPPPPKGMKKGLKIGLIVGGSILALSVIGFIIYKSKKK